MRALMAGLSIALAATAAAAGPYDGVYRPNYDFAAGWNCRDIGMDGGAVAVRDGVLYGIENACQLTNPTQVRGMAATLYDAVCSGEGESYSYRVMLMRTDEGILMIQEGFAADWLRCR